MAKTRIPKGMTGTYLHADDVKKIVKAAGGRFDLGECQPCTRRVVVDLAGEPTVVQAEFSTQGGIDQLDIQL